MSRGKIREIKHFGTEEDRISIIEKGNFTFAYQLVPSFRSVSVGIWFPVGSRHEPEGIDGISHLIEHLIFKGTKRYRAEKISDIFDSLGARVNAFTGKETTCYYAHMVSDNLDKTLKLLNHILKEPAFRDSDISSEKNVVFQEIAMYEDSPDEMVHDYFASALFKGSSLGKPVIGTRETVAVITRSDLIDYYERFYPENHFYVTAAGNLDEMLIERIIDLAGSPEEKHARENNRAENSEGYFFEVKETAQSHICFGYKLFGAGNPDEYAVAVLDAILGGMMSSRLFREIREKRGQAYSVFSYHTFYRDTGYITSYAGTSHEKAASTLRLMKREFEKLIEKPVSERELKKAIENVKSNLVLSSESMRARMMWIGRNLLSKSDIVSMSEAVERIESVTAEDIQRIARTYFTQKPVVAAIGNFKEENLLKASGIF